MPGEDKAGAQAPAPEPVVEATETTEAYKPKPGFVKHLATDTFHEVEDVEATLKAYPGQYEKAKSPGEKSSKLGWPVEKGN